MPLEETKGTWFRAFRLYTVVSLNTNSYLVGTVLQNIQSNQKFIFKSLSTLKAVRMCEIELNGKRKKNRIEKKCNEKEKMGLCFFFNS